MIKQGTPSTAERRPKRRNQVLLAGIVTFDGGGQHFTCTIHDISETGARIGFRGQPFPSAIYLINMRDRLVYDATVIWARKCEAGLKFLKSIPLSKIKDPALGYLRELWHTQATR